MGPSRKSYSKVVKENVKSEKILDNLDEQKTVFKCVDHEIYFSNGEKLAYHIENECDMMLNLKNVCTYQDEEEKCCMQDFKIGASLILHYYRFHELNACDMCYETFLTSKELEEHEHEARINVRKSEYYSDFFFFFITNLF